MRSRVVALAIVAVGVAVAAWLLLRTLDEPTMSASSSETGSETPRPPAPATTIPHQPELDVPVDAEVVEKARPDAMGTLRVTIDAPGRSSGAIESMYLLVKADILRVVPVPPNHVVVEQVVAGTHTLRVGTVSALEGEDMTVVVRENETTEVRIHVDPPTRGRLRVTAVDDDAQPIDGARLAVVGNGVAARLFTFSNGVGAIYLPAGEYTLSQGRTSVRAQVVAGTTRDVEIRVSPLAIVRGVVVDTSGRRIARAEVTVTRDTIMKSRRTADASGAFAVPVTFEPPFDVAAKDGSAESPIVQADGTQPIRLEIGGGATITGTVLRADGTPVPSFQVDIMPTRGSSFTNQRAFTNGTFAWGNLAADEYRLTAIVSPFVIRKTVTIPPDTRSVAVALALPRLVSLRGRVVDAVSRDPIAGAIGRADRVYSFGDPVSMVDSPEIRTDTSGHFTAAVMFGSYQLAFAGTAMHLATNQTVKVGDADLDLGDISIPRAHK